MSPFPSAVRSAGTSPVPVSAAARGRNARILAAGADLARDAGIPEPSDTDAVWVLLQEAAETLRLLPDRERAWLRSGTYASWPPILRSYAETFAAAVDRGGRWEEPRADRLPAPGAVARMEGVLTWYGAIGGRNPRRDVGVVFALAAGVPVRTIRQRFGLGRRTVYDIRERGLARIVARLNPG
jgi:hypothetical protein